MIHPKTLEGMLSLYQIRLHTVHANTNQEEFNDQFIWAL